MAQMDKTYINEIQKQFGYHPAWAPNRPYELGDYGDPQNDQFEMLGNIRKWVTPKPSSHASGPMYYTSTDITLSGKAPIAAQGVPVAQLDLRNFSVTKNASRVMTYQGANLTPLFRLSEVKDPITKKAHYTEYK